MRVAPTLYQWLGLDDDPLKAVHGLNPPPFGMDPRALSHACNLEPVIVGGGEWRGRLLRQLSAPMFEVAPADIQGSENGDGGRGVLVFRELDGDALLADGRVFKRHIAKGRVRDGLHDVFKSLHEKLEELGKPWMPELSPCRPKPVTNILADLDFECAAWPVIDRHDLYIDLSLESLLSGPWTRHLSERELEWLRGTLQIDAAERVPLALSIKTWVWRLKEGAAPPAEPAAHLILSSVLDGSAVHIDRWPTQLPQLDSNNSDEQIDKDVRLLFRAITSRLGQNGRLCPGHHQYLVMNLWESVHSSTALLQDGEEKGGQFAPATEFVFAVPSPCTPEQILKEALRTIVYLALVKLNGDRTIHSVTESLFLRRRPLLRVYPGELEEHWRIQAERAWSAERAESEFVPMGIDFAYPRSDTYGQVLDLLENITNSAAAKTFIRTIWCAAPDGFYAFPWDSQDTYAGNADQPAFFGRAAGEFVDEVADVMRPMAQAIWQILGSSEDDEHRFKEALRAMLQESGKKLESEDDAQWMYRALLATSIFFDDRNFEHRQVAVPIAEQDGVFVAAGTYLITQRKGRQSPIMATATEANPRVAAFDQSLARLYSVQIASHATRTLLSIASMRITRRIVQEQTHKTVMERERNRWAKMRQRAAASTKQLTDALNKTKRDLNSLVGLPGQLWMLWEDRPDEAGENWLSEISHKSLSLDEMKAKRTTYKGGIETALIGASPKVIAALVTDVYWVLESESEEVHTERTRLFKQRCRNWNKPDNDDDSLVKRVEQTLGRQIDSWVIGDLTEYPSMAEIWVDCLRSLAEPSTAVRRDGNTIAAFIMTTPDGVQAGFVFLSFEPNPPAAEHSVRLKKKVGDFLDGWIEEPEVLRYQDGQCGHQTSLAADLKQRIDREFGKRQHGVAVVMAGFAIGQLK
jgi:hypothetical protein